MARIENLGAKNKITYLENQAITDNTIPFDLMLFELQASLTNEQIIEHIGNLLNIKLKIVKEKK